MACNLNCCVDNCDFCQSNHSIPYNYQQWVENIVVGWLEVVYCGGRGQLSSSDPAIQALVTNSLNQTYITALYHTYTTTRIDQLFNIVIGEKSTLDSCLMFCIRLCVQYGLYNILFMVKLIFTVTLSICMGCRISRISACFGGYQRLPGPYTSQGSPCFLAQIGHSGQSSLQGYPIIPHSLLGL